MTTSAGPDLSLDGLFRRLDELKKEKLHGRDKVDGRWTLNRFEIEIHNNGLGTWTASIRDWKQVTEPGGGIGLGINKDPATAIAQALYKIGVP